MIIPEEKDINFSLVAESDADIAYVLLVAVLGSSKYAFNEIEKKSMEAEISKAVESCLLPGQSAVVKTGELV